MKNSFDIEKFLKPFADTDLFCLFQILLTYKSYKKVFKKCDKDVHIIGIDLLLFINDFQNKKFLFKNAFHKRRTLFV